MNACPAVLEQRGGGSGPLGLRGGFSLSQAAHLRGLQKQNQDLNGGSQNKADTESIWELVLKVLPSLSEPTTSSGNILRSSSSLILTVACPQTQILTMEGCSHAPLFRQCSQMLSVFLSPSEYSLGPSGAHQIWPCSSWAMFAAPRMSLLWARACPVSLHSVSQTWSPQDQRTGSRPTFSWSWIQCPLPRAPPWPSRLSSMRGAPRHFPVCSLTVGICLLAVGFPVRVWGPRGRGFVHSWLDVCTQGWKRPYVLVECVHACVVILEITLLPSCSYTLHNILEIQPGCANEKRGKSRYSLTHRDNFPGTFDMCVCLCM